MQKINKENLQSFFQEQKENWPLAKNNYNGLEKVEEKEFQFEGFKIKVQFNPERIKSTSAKVDKEAIEKRACFLCEKNRPELQTKIELENGYSLLVNPFPILKQHFTIPQNEHIDQNFINHIGDMLNMAECLEGYSFFYNGPKSGASAPDHMHFQAGENGFMPTDSEYINLKKNNGKLITYNDRIKVYSFNHYLRKMISIEADRAQDIVSTCKILYSSFEKLQAEEKEPLLNAICIYKNKKYCLHIFPRKLHRPSQFFAEGNDQLLISPGAVDMGGVIITPRKEDFDKITKEDIIDIYKQVSLDDFAFDKLCQNFTKLVML
ncbi:DUF4922 domain-containing protein [Ancylomarina sp. 16SWW S1-10-2]|uniref:DUF4922 domain-containing protein n=1 Tax=Ancylomarina sp. 16SWW S1-10-2 TaxID=2499681 RepID=UPI0012AE742B|nr:DUF4922 domain-containing protein [Ancylomarina sp. 16SWW S1-10-2]MRT94054.1 DUF4922 domain-containing protein [Ancylomarina sp. 16SWW S1-10-2]